MRIGLYVSTATGVSLDEILSRFADAEARGLHTAWTGQVLEHDALTLLALAARVTDFDAVTFGVEGDANAVERTLAFLAARARRA